MELDSWIDPLWVSSWSSWKPLSNQISLRTDIKETNDQYNLMAECPGMNKEDLKVQFEGDSLTISGEKKKKRDERKENWHVVERSYGKFERTLRFPENANLEKLKAKYEDGVLNVSIPKFEHKSKRPKLKDVPVE